MGEQKVVEVTDSESRRRFMRYLIRDVQALERMIKEGMLELDKRRIGAEQEMFLVHRSGMPAKINLDVLEKCNDRRFVPELGSYNIEANIDPLEFGGNCLSKLEEELNGAIKIARNAAKECKAEVVLCGILPTLRTSDGTIESMTPLPRYYALNNAMRKMRQHDDFRFRIRGTEELVIRSDSLMVEAFNTSFQVHFQVGASEFPQMYNRAQVLAGPILAISSNSSLLFGRRLWDETRIALFQQSIDTRTERQQLRDSTPRVNFGNDWVHKSVLEIFQEDIARFPLILILEDAIDSNEQLDRGETPELSSLMLHNGTVYRWTRACYGMSNNTPHLRIEYRILPAGPSVIDEVANAALWFGLMSALSEDKIDVRPLISFNEAKTNFFTAARRGLRSQLTWIDGKVYPVSELFTKFLIPMAGKGLRQSSIDPADITRYLGVIEGRIAASVTGASWALDSFTELRGWSRPARARALTRAMITNQKTGLPVHKWPLATKENTGLWEENYLRAEQYMITDLFTVKADELIDLVASIMQWRSVGHVPVEDENGHLVGLVDYRSLLPLVTHDQWRSAKMVPVSEFMDPNPATVPPNATTREVMQVMKKKGNGCVLVVEEKHTIGMITLQDLLPIGAKLFSDRVKYSGEYQTIE